MPINLWLFRGHTGISAVILLAWKLVEWLVREFHASTTIQAGEAFLNWKWLHKITWRPLTHKISSVFKINCYIVFHNSDLFLMNPTEILYEEGQSKGRSSKGSSSEWKDSKWQSERTHYTRHKSQCNRHEAQWEQEGELSNLKSLYVYFSVNFFIQKSKMKSEKQSTHLNCSVNLHA